MSKVGLAVKFSELGINKEAILDDLLAEVNEERFANNPEPFNRKKVKRINSGTSLKLQWVSFQNINR
jgi:hypothetical protein